MIKYLKASRRLLLFKKNCFQSPSPLLLVRLEVVERNRKRLNLATALALCIFVFAGLQILEFKFRVGLSSVFTFESLTRICSLLPEVSGLSPPGSVSEPQWPR